MLRCHSRPFRSHPQIDGAIGAQPPVLSNVGQMPSVMTSETADRTGPSTPMAGSVTHVPQPVGVHAAFSLPPGPRSPGESHSPVIGLNAAGLNRELPFRRNL
jgi:hypothetical protein